METLTSAIFEYKFISNALWAGLFAAITCGVIGTYIVANRIVFLSGGITHSSFGGIGIGYFLNINPIIGAAVFSVLSGLGIELFSTRAKVRHDSVIGIWWSFGMAIGIIFVYLTPGYAPNLMTYLFGSILSVSGNDIVFMAIMTIIIVLIFIFFYRLILYISFDEEYAKTQGLKVGLMKNILISLVALAIVINIKVVGIILLLSLLTIPQAIANFFTNKFDRIIYYSIGINLIGIFVGLVLSYNLDIPSGASIIFALILFFGIAWIIKFVSAKNDISK